MDIKERDVNISRQDQFNKEFSEKLSNNNNED